MSEFDPTKIDKTNLSTLWERVATYVKKLTGDVNVTTSGTLQEQIDALEDTENQITDDTTGQVYQLGVDNGLIYIQEVEE